jgi:VWFA-related protein
MAGKSQQVIEGAMAFIDASNPQDEEFVINFADKVTLGLPANLAFTSNGNELKAALSTASASGRTALYDAVIAALQHLDLRQASKKALILISDGGDNLSQHTLAEVLRMAQSANVAIYTIGLLNEESADQNPKVLRQFAKETGGVAYFPGSSADIARVCRQIAADIRHQYTLAYSPAGERHNAYRKIRVDVIAPKEGKLLVRTRAGYFRPSTMAANSTGTRKVGR